VRDGQVVSHQFHVLVIGWFDSPSRYMDIHGMSIETQAVLGAIAFAAVYLLLLTGTK
jgi:hypothetical protein